MNEQDFLRRIEAEMLQEGLLQRRDRHAQHVECTCPHCKPWEGYVVKWAVSTERKLLAELPSIDAVFPRIFSVRLRGEAYVSVDRKGRKTSWRGMPLGHFVALPSAMPLVDSESISVE